MSLFCSLYLTICSWMTMIFFSEMYKKLLQGFPGGSVVKNLPANREDADLITGSRRSPGGGNGNPPCFLAWKIPWTEEPCQATVYEVSKSQHNQSDWICTHSNYCIEHLLYAQHNARHLPYVMSLTLKCRFHGNTSVLPTHCPVIWTGLQCLDQHGRPNFENNSNTT